MLDIGSAQIIMMARLMTLNIFLLTNVDTTWEGGSLSPAQDTLSSWEILWEETGRPWALLRLCSPRAGGGGQCPGQLLL